MILSNRTIKALCNPGVKEHQRYLQRLNEQYMLADPDTGSCLRPLNSMPMIEPFVDTQVREDRDGNPITSYGLSYSGYDIRLCPEFRIFSKPNDGRVIDIKQKSHADFDENVSEVVHGPSIVIPPGGLVLSSTIEHFHIPTQVTGTCVGKSTLARSGLLVNVTPLEPGWHGHLVVELTNGTNLPLRVYAGEGIAQIVFHLLDRSVEGYQGVYQAQRGIVGSRVGKKYLQNEHTVSLEDI